MKLIYPNIERKEVRLLAHHLSEYLWYEEGMKCLILRDISGDYIVQSRDKHWAITRWMGIDMDIYIRLSMTNHHELTATIRQSSSLRKVLVLLTSLIIFWPAAILPVIGLLRHVHFPWKIREVTSQYLITSDDLKSFY